MRRLFLFLCALFSFTPVFAAGAVDFSAVTGAIDFTSVISALMLVGAAAAAAYLAWVGLKFVLRMVKSV